MLKVTNNEIVNKISDLASRGVQLWTDSGKLKFKAAAGVMTDEDKSFLRANKESVITCLLNDEVRIEIDEEHQFEPFGLTEIQQAYVLGRNPAFEYGGTACHIYLELEYDMLDPTKAEDIWNLLIKRHPMLRATMSVDGYQQIAPEVPRFNIAVEDLRNSDAITVENARRRIKEEYDHKIYDPAVWPLYSVAISRGNGKDIMHLSIEFVVADWASIWTVLSEFESMYFTPDMELPQVDITFRDYLTAERKLRQGSNYYRDKEYWLSRIDTLPKAPELPTLNNSEDMPVKFEREQFALNKSEWDSFCSMSRKFGVTPTAALMCAYGVTLARWSKNKSFCLNLSILNRLRIHPQVDQIVGDFTASNLLQMEQRENQSFAEIALQTNRQLFDDLDHRLFTGVDVVRELRHKHGSQGALMPYVFTGAVGLISTEKSKLVGKMTDNGISQTPQVFMDCQAMDTADGLNINIDSRVGVFPNGLVCDVCGALYDLLKKLSVSESAWEGKPFRISLPKWQREERLLVNGTSNTHNKSLLHEGVLRQIQEHPDRLAVADYEESWSGGELYRQVVKIAASLKKLGVKRGDFVAVALPKSRWQTAACLGALAVGAAYVPLDIKQAPKRCEMILNKVSAKCVICHSEEEFKAPADIAVIKADTLEDEQESDFTISFADSRPEDVAYIIFTSGSTGDPKGVTMSHSAAMNTIDEINRMFNVSENDRIFNLSQLNFDLSVYDVFGVIAKGGAVIIPDHKQYKNPVHWIEMINKYNVTIWNSVPALMQMLLIYQSYNADAWISPLRLVLLSGDWIPLDQPEKLRALFPNVRVVSLGGATEGGIWSIYHECTPNDENDTSFKSIPYGKPLANQGFMILDEFLEDCPVWVQGELYITGESLADSYWGESELTLRSFVEINGVRAYKTGDTGCYHPGGEIEFLGRLDNQVKIRGHRIELGEIESVIKREFNINDACCLVYTSNNEKKLAAVAVTENPIEEKELEERLSPWLPKYMIPTICIVTDSIPLTSNGKTDVKALTNLVDNYYESHKSSVVCESEMNDIEKAVHDVVSATLNVKALELDEDFYEAGANSLILARIAGQLNQEVESSIPFDAFLVQLLSSPNIREVAKFVINKINNSDKALCNDESSTEESVLLWQRSDNSVEVCVVFTPSLSENLINICQKDNKVNILYVNGEIDIQELTEVILQENPEYVSLISADSETEKCLNTASSVMLHGIVPYSVSIIESESETEPFLDTPYMGDINIGLTVSDMEEKEEIISIMEELCIGEIEVVDCSTEDSLIDFVCKAISIKY